MGNVDAEIIIRLKKRALEIGTATEAPLFYREKILELEQARKIETESKTVHFAMSAVRRKGDVLGHGYQHARKVALESGAIVFSELGFSEHSNRLAEKGIIAGYLHDIQRDQKDHPEKGAVVAGNLLADKLEARDVEMIMFAIRNHEAFKKYHNVDDSDFMLLADSLYDADKFRWGPDNFLYTLWDMAESMNLTLDFIMLNYEKGIEGIRKIKQTFRTNTGRYYGPDFIDRGLKIGELIYSLFIQEVQNNA